MSNSNTLSKKSWIALNMAKYAENGDDEVRLFDIFHKGKKSAAILKSEAGNLSKSRTALLNEEILEGDRAREQLIVSNIKLVRQIASEYRFDIEFEDMVSEGVRGLTQAIDRFKPVDGSRLSSYAVLWIKSRIQRCLAVNRPGIGIPERMMSKLAKVNRVAFQLEERLGRTPRNSEIAEELGLSEGRITELRRRMQQVKSLHELVSGGGEDGSSVEFGDTIVDDSTEDASTAAMANDDIKLLEDGIRTLTDREQEIVSMRFGLRPGSNEMTLLEIGATYGRTRQRIEQIEKIIFNKLRAYFRELKMKTELTNK